MGVANECRVPSEVRYTLSEHGMCAYRLFVIGLFCLLRRLR